MQSYCGQREQKPLGPLYIPFRCLRLLKGRRFEFKAFCHLCCGCLLENSCSLQILDSFASDTACFFSVRILLCTITFPPTLKCRAMYVGASKELMLWPGCRTCSIACWCWKYCAFHEKALMAGVLVAKSNPLKQNLTPYIIYIPSRNRNVGLQPVCSEPNACAGGSDATETAQQRP